MALADRTSLSRSSKQYEVPLNPQMTIVIHAVHSTSRSFQDDDSRGDRVAVRDVLGKDDARTLRYNQKPWRRDTRIGEDRIRENQNHQYCEQKLEHFPLLRRFCCSELR